MQTDNIVPARAEVTASSVRAHSLTSLLMRTTALAGLALITLPAIAALTALTATPAMADGGAGGSSFSGSGGSGGSDSASSAGGIGGNAAAGGGGGGAGVTGGSGSGGSGGGSGGNGGTAAANGVGGSGGNGQDDGVDGGGGGGGAHGYFSNSGLLPGMAVTGGNGGDGGYGGLGGSGGGGAGGWGASIMNSISGTLNFNVTGGNGGDGGTVFGSSVAGDGGSGGTGLYLGSGSGTVVISSSVTGGNGGQGGGGGGDGVGGNGGNGGAGLYLGSGAANVVISSTVTGGNGGSGGSGGGANGNPGAGGVGIVSNGASITVSGTGSVIGGMSGDTSTQARAITFAGGTNVRLELWSGATISGSVNASGATGATFALGGTAAGTFDISKLGTGQQYSGFTAFDKAGASTWTLTGTSTFAGPATVSAGTLIVNGSIANSSVTVHNGAALGGTGTVGSLTFDPGSTYQVNVSPLSASLITVTGTAALGSGNATVNAVFAPGSYVTHQYTILHAATLTGTFSGLVNTLLPANVTKTLSYDSHNAYLNLTLSQPTGDNGLNRNQNNVFNPIANIFNSGGAVPGAFLTLTPSGLTQASGETVTASQQATFNAMNMFMGILTDPYAAGRGGNASPSSPGAMSYAQQRSPRDAYAMFTKAMPQNDPFAARWTMWASGFGGSQTTNGNGAAGSNTSTSSIFGVAVGADYRISPNTLAGFGMSGGGTNFSVANGGSGRSDMLQAGGFVRHAIGASYLTAAATYAWQDVTTNRNVIGTDQLQGRFNANAFSGRFEAGTRYIIPSWMGGIGATPYAAVQVTAYDLPAYTETVQSGPGVFALGYAAKDVTSTRSELGLRTDRTYALTDSVLTLRGRFAWAHEFDPDRSIGATFQSVPGASFVVNGARQASDAALTTASAELRWRSGVSLAGIFEGEFSDVTRSYAGKGVLRYQW